MGPHRFRPAWLQPRGDGRPSLRSRYGLALGIALVAVLLRLAPHPWVGSAAAPFGFVLAVSLGAFLGGLGPGLVVTAIMGVAMPYLIFEPHLTWSLRGPADHVELWAFVALGLVISVLCELLIRARHEAERANRAKDHFLAALSHELRTPLTPVLLVTESLEGSNHLPAEVLADLKSIRRNITLETRLIDDLLDLSRVAQGKLTLAHELVNLHEVLEHAFEVVSKSFVRARKIRFHLELSAANPWVWGDPVRLQQVFWNLIRNAIKFTSEGGAVTVRTGNRLLRNRIAVETTEAVVVQVQDTGVGIAPEFLPSIFNAFAQESAAVTHRFGGLGMGLAIAKAVVDAHGGSIAVASPGKDQGATFTVQLKAEPAARLEQDLRQRAQAQEEPPPCGSVRVLLVEDNEDTARLLSRLLTTQGHQVRTAGSVHEALDLAAAEPFDVLVSDLGLPDGSGLDVIKGVRDLGLLTPAIAVSGYGMSDDIQRSRRAGFVEHLVKPLDVDRLGSVLRRVAAGGALPKPLRHPSAR